jgi:hypothetical protein
MSPKQAIVRLIAVSLVSGVLPAVSCGPGGGDDEAPPRLEVQPLSIEFGATEDTKFVEVRNSGGGLVTFSVKVSAESDGVTWLAVEPLEGSVEGGSARALLAKVENRQMLKAGSYSGEIKVEGEGTGSVTAAVTLHVGKPLLETDPAEILDFGTASTTETLFIANKGEGTLLFEVHTPGAWMTVESDLQNQVASGDVKTVKLVIDRAEVPWYGQGEDSLVITSNGGEDDSHAGTVKLRALVTVEAPCQSDADCKIGGSFCDDSSGNGVCAKKRDLGVDCGDAVQCISSHCSNGVCCDVECEGACRSCGLESKKGTCSPVQDGTACDDGLYCTAGDSCQDGDCSGPEARDCTELDSPCAKAYCDEGSASCRVDPPANQCVIGGTCYQAGDSDPEADCRLCQPELDPTAFTLRWNACFIDGVCFQAGDAVEAECQICDPAQPDESSPAADGASCAADENGCTADVCMEGTCTHVPLTTGACDDSNTCTKKDQCQEGVCTGEPYPCDDGLDCTTDSCNGDGTCEAPILPGFCLVGNACYAADDPAPASAGCAYCAPEASQAAWTLMPEKSACDDGNLCTSFDHCAAGICTGEAKTCEDGLECTADACNPADGACTAPLQPGWCLILGECVTAATSPGGPDSGCLICKPSEKTDGWTLHNEGMACDDLSGCSADSVCHLGACEAVGALCDDGKTCTKDSCTADNTCEHAPVPDDSPCESDDVACTTDVCLQGTCSHPLAKDMCRIEGECVQAGSKAPSNVCRSCQPALDEDGWSPVPDDSPCESDDVACTEDRCEKGTCTHGLAAGYCLIDTVCTAGGAESPSNPCAVCNAALSSSGWSPGNEGMLCDDDLYCTVEDACAAGVCQGIDRVCASDQCTDSWCLEQQDTCVNGPKKNGIPCDDASACTLEDKCQQGICAGTAKDCSAAAGSNPCLTGYCDPASKPVPGVCAASSVAQGEPCDDSLVCTTDTVCDGKGSCAGGIVVTKEDCTTLLKNSDPCVAASCLEPSGCVLGPVAPGANCVLTNAAAAQCLEGECRVIDCAEGYEDCDNVHATGCEIDVHHDPNNCLQCGKVCQLDHAVSTCYGAKGCVIIDCSPGYDDCDQNDADGCEADTSGDPEQCGGCGVECKTADPLTVGVCSAGKCASQPCPKGALNVDGLPGNGCEVQNVIYVDAGNFMDSMQDGTFGHPFDTIQEGIDAALADYTVYVVEGIYAGQIAVNKKGLNLSGEGITKVLVNTPALGTGFVISKNQVKISGFKISGGRYGVHFKGTPAVPLVGGGANDLLIENLTGPQPTDGETTWGLAVEYASDVAVADVEIRSLQGGAGISPTCLACNGLTGGQAVGILMSGATSVNVTRAVIHGLAGGPGGNAEVGNVFGGGDGGKGGTTAAIRMLNSTDCSVTDSDLYSVQGGLGGKAGIYRRGGSGGVAAAFLIESSNGNELTGNKVGALGPIQGGRAGISMWKCCNQEGAGGVAGEMGVGFYLLASTGCTLAGNALKNIVGGLGSDTAKQPDGTQQYGGDGPPQAAFGVYLDPTSYDNTIAQTNTIEGEPIVYLYGADGAVVSDLDLTADANPTNLGKIAVLDSKNVTITGNTISGYKGGAGYVGWTLQLAPAGWDAFGILLSKCTGCTVSGNAVSGITGGQGATGGEAGTGGSGGVSYGIYAADSPSVVLENNTVAEINGGPGGISGWKGSHGIGVGGIGGWALGFSLRSCQGAKVKGNTARFLYGGNGGEAQKGGNGGGCGGSQGFSFVSSGLTFSSNIAAMLKTGTGTGAPALACVGIDKCQPLTVANLTCYGPGSGGTGIGRGIQVDAGQASLVKVVDSIFSTMAGHCLFSAAPSDAYLKATYSAFFSCQAGYASNAQINQGCLQGQDPKFVNPLAASMKLLNSSPCIDTADPASPFAGEPNPNGCRADMGAYGNTAEATSKPGAQHCK